MSTTEKKAKTSPVELVEVLNADGEVVYPCSKCERSFLTQGALNGHQRAHSFFAFVGKSVPKEQREQERAAAHTKIVYTAIKYYSHNAKQKGAHCDVCAIVREVVDKPLMRDLMAWMESERAA